MMDYKGHKCVYCHEILTEHDDVVICPECGAPYHRECYLKAGKCVFSDRHGIDFEYIPPESKVSAGAKKAICPSCHAENPEDALFCESCGQPMRPWAGPQGTAGGPAYNGMPDMSGPGAQYTAANVRTQLHIAKEYDGISTEEWSQYIGNAAPYYLYQFQRMNESGRKTSFCWSALFLPEFYYFYRKMWGWGVLALALTLAVSVPSFLSMLALAGAADFLPFSIDTLNMINNITFFASWGLRIVSGLFACHLYRRSAAKQILKIRDQYSDTASFQTELAKHSGPSRIAVVIVCILTVLLSIGVSFWIAPLLSSSLFYL